MFISHYHGLDDGFANLEEGSGWFEDDRASTASVVHRFVAQDSVNLGEVPNICYDVSYSALNLGGWAETDLRYPKDIRTLTALRERVTIAAEVKSYLHNIVSFLRLHRAVGGGITPRATRHFNLLVKLGLPTPSIFISNY